MFGGCKYYQDSAVTTRIYNPWITFVSTLFTKLGAFYYTLPAPVSNQILIAIYAFLSETFVVLDNKLITLVITVSGDSCYLTNLGAHQRIVSVSVRICI